MKKRGPGRHVTPGTIMDYLSQRLSEFDEVDFDSHLGACDECADKVRSARRVTEMFEGWLAAPPAFQNLPKSLSLRVLAALEAAERTADSAVAERIRKWRELGGKAEAAVRIVRTAPQAAAEILLEGVEALVLPQPRWQFAYPATRARGAVRTRGRQPKLKEETRLTGAGHASVGDPSGSSITVEGGKINVRVRGLPQGKVPPIVLLVPDAVEEKPSATRMEMEKGTEDYVATLGTASYGAFTLLLEPFRETK